MKRKTVIRKQAVLLVILCCMLAPVRGVAQETESPEEVLVIPEKNIFTDAGYAVLGLTSSNVILNLANRLADQSFAHTTFRSIWENMANPAAWFWEDGDRFLVNQFCHPYQGATYFASARTNGFGFYQSMLFVPLGALMWEIALEPEPAINDVITTTIGGIAFGEMLHRLFLEANASSSVPVKIIGYVLSPFSGYFGMYNRPVYETGGNTMCAVSVKSGIEKTFAFFPEHEEHADSWNYPGGHCDVHIVYGDPYIRQSALPYEHFELSAAISSNIATYNAAIVSDGYLFSLNPLQTERSFTSTGLSMHLDFYNATNEIVDNIGYGNIQFSSSAIGWTVKNQYLISGTSRLETRVHCNAVVWGTSMYNADFSVDDYWVPLGNTHGSYGVGENIKMSCTLYQSRMGNLYFNAYAYHIFTVPVTENHSRGNVFFLYGSFGYEFPLTAKIGIGAQGTFWGLFGMYDSAGSVNRRLVSNGLYVRYSF